MDTKKVMEVTALIHRHGALWVIDPITARPKDTITWMAPDDMIILLPQEPERRVFVDPDSGEPVSRLPIKHGESRSVLVQRTPNEYEAEQEEFPYAIYWENWEDHHSAFFIGGSHPNIIVRW